MESPAAAQEITTPSPVEKVTDSWNAYKNCMKSIQHFLNEISVRDAEVWLGEVCLGSPDNSWIRAPLKVDSAALVHHSVEHAETLVYAVTESVKAAVETSRRVIEELNCESGVPRADLVPIIERTDSLAKLQAELTSVASLAPIKHHPRILIRWREILERSFVPGDPAVRVEVVTVHVL